MMDCGNCGYWKFTIIAEPEHISLGKCQNVRSYNYDNVTPYYLTKDDGKRLDCWRPEGGQKEPVYE